MNRVILQVLRMALILGTFTYILGMPTVGVTQERQSNSKFKFAVQVKNSGEGVETVNRIRVAIPVVDGRQVKLSGVVPTSLKGIIYNDLYYGVYVDFDFGKVDLASGVSLNNGAGFSFMLELATGAYWAPTINSSSIRVMGQSSAQIAARSAASDDITYTAELDAAHGWDWHSSSFWGSLAQAAPSVVTPWSTNTIGSQIDAGPNSCLPGDGWELFIRRLVWNDFWGCGDAECSNFKDADKYFALYNRKLGVLRYFLWVSKEPLNVDFPYWDIALIAQGGGTNYFNSTNGSVETSTNKPLQKTASAAKLDGSTSAGVQITLRKWYTVDFSLDYDALQGQNGLERLTLRKIQNQVSYLKIDGTLLKIYDTINRAQSSSSKGFFNNLASDAAGVLAAKGSGIISSELSKLGAKAGGWVSNKIEAEGCKLAQSQTTAAMYPMACWDAMTNSLLPPDAPPRQRPIPEVAKVQAYMSAAKTIKDKGPAFISDIVTANVPGLVSKAAEFGFSLLFGNDGVQEEQTLIQQIGESVDLSGKITQSTALGDLDVYRVNMASGSPQLLEKISYFAKKHGGSERLGLFSLRAKPFVTVTKYTTSKTGWADQVERVITSVSDIESCGWLKVNPYSGNSISSVDYQIIDGSMASDWRKAVNFKGYKLRPDQYNQLQVRVRVTMASNDAIPVIVSREVTLDADVIETAHVRRNIICAGGGCFDPTLKFDPLVDNNRLGSCEEGRSAAVVPMQNSRWEMKMEHPELVAEVYMCGNKLKILEYKHKSIVVAQTNKAPQTCLLKIMHNMFPSAVPYVYFNAAIRPVPMPWVLLQD